MADGFLGRWSQRKTAARDGRPADKDGNGVAPAAPVASDAAVPQTTPVAATRPAPVAGDRGDMPQAPEAPPPTMRDVAALRADSDFKPFVARAVAPEVRNAAMKKLFADPHFNVMDGLDTYIDDYSLPDPLPLAMVRKMASAQFLKLFDDEAEKPGDAPIASDAEPSGQAAPAAPAQPAPDDGGPDHQQAQSPDTMDPDGMEPRT